MSKPIESGCRAVIVNSEAGNNGKEVTVISFYGETSKSGKCWNCDTVLLGADSHDSIVPEFQLRRIDDDNEEAGSWTTIEALTNWNPTKEAVNEPT